MNNEWLEYIYLFVLTGVWLELTVGNAKVLRIFNDGNLCHPNDDCVRTPLRRRWSVTAI